MNDFKMVLKAFIGAKYYRTILPFYKNNPKMLIKIGEKLRSYAVDLVDYNARIGRWDNVQKLQLFIYEFDSKVVNDIGAVHEQGISSEK